MKYAFIYLICFLTAAVSYAADEHTGHDHGDHEGHDHAAHQEVSDHDEHASSLEGLDEAREEHADEDHEGHDHAMHEEDDDHPPSLESFGEAGEDHSGHDHATHEEEKDPPSLESSGMAGDDHADHEGHGHPPSRESFGEAQGDSTSVALSDEIAAKVGIVVRSADSGQIERVNTFPAEVALNRTRLYPLTPRYPSIVRELQIEIGDTVVEGQELIRLENRENLASYVLKAPGNGTVVSKNTSIGESVSEDTVLIEVADLSSVWVEIDIFPQYQHSVKKGQSVRLVATDGHTADAEIAYISPLLSHETRTRKARAVLEQPDEDFMPGAFVRAEITLSEENEVVRVERDAVQQLDRETVVFVPGKDGYSPQEVRVGHIGRHYAEIISGLQAGEEYVAEGAFDLKAEMLTSGMDAHAGHGH